MRFSMRLKPCYNLIDITPLVNVIFLMLIFFMFTSDTLSLKSLLIEHPKIPVEEPAKLAQLIVIMDKDQVLYVGSKKEIVDLASLGDALKRHIALWQNTHQGATPTVVLSIDRRIDYDMFLRVFHEVTQTTSTVRLACTPDATFQPDKEALE